MASSVGVGKPVSSKLVNKILLPVDFHGTSLRVIRPTVVLSRHFQCEVVLLHVIAPPSYLAYTLSGHYVPAKIVSRARKQLESFLEEELKGIAIKRLLLEGDPAAGIIATAREEKVDLIMMPTHGYGPLRRLLLGSVTAKVLHDRQCPVWTAAHVENEPAGEFAVRSILCAVDLTEHSCHTVSWAAKLAAEFGARLTLAHVTAGVEIFGPGGTYEIPELKEELSRSARQQMIELQRQVNIETSSYFGSGVVPEQLNVAAVESGADLLVIGCRPTSARLRTNAYAIVRESRIPVLSV